jgi:DNA-binding CsgD family transcriptional regulator
VTTLGDPETGGVATLSAREREVFDLLARGHRPNEIGRALFISAHTVRKHVKLIFRKLGVHSQIELMRRYFTRDRVQ